MDGAKVYISDKFFNSCCMVEEDLLTLRLCSIFWKGSKVRQIFLLKHQTWNGISVDSFDLHKLIPKIERKFNPFEA